MCVCEKVLLEREINKPLLEECKDDFLAVITHGLAVFALVPQDTLSSLRFQRCQERLH
jgi:hypothetical protein